MVGKWWTITAALALGSMSVSQLHAADGLYLGAGVGAATVKDSFNTETFDQEDVAYRAFVGWRFDQVPIIDLAVEAAYTNFGKPSQTIVQGGAAQNVEFKLHGASLAGLLILPLGPIDLYAKGGVIDWKADQTVNGSTTGRSGTDAFYGAGIGFYLWILAFRAEYERYQIKDVDRVQMLSLNVLFQF
jgi:outer membrane immunogenic protein